MSKIREYFEKAGGMKLIKQWAKLRVLHIAIIQFLLLGTSKKSLELLRNVINLKVQRKLRKKYKSILEECDKIDATNLKHESNKTVWIFWWQGIENAPLLVKRCYQSVKSNLRDWDIKVLSKDNYQDYVKFPTFILEKFNKKEISITHLSDLLRLELLINYGGLWLDSTVMCTSSCIPKIISDADLFVYQTQKPGADGHATVMSNWLIKSKTNNKLLITTRNLLYKYWKRNKYITDYFIFHQFFTIACQRYQEECKKIPPYTNENPHILLLHLFDKYNDNLWEDWKKQTCFHKLSYKFNNNDTEKEGTFYEVIIKKHRL